MKAPNIYQYIAIGIAVILVITIIVLYFCVPMINHYLTGGVIGALAGFISGYVAGRKNILGHEKD